MSNETHLREGVVLKKPTKREAEVLIIDLASCKGCEGGCEEAKHKNSIKITAEDPVGTSEEDKVELELKPRSFGKISGIVFGVPVLSLLAGIGLGTLLSNNLLSGEYSRILQGGLSGLLFLGSLGFLIYYDRTLASQDETRATITKIVTLEE